MFPGYLANGYGSRDVNPMLATVQSGSQRLNCFSVLLFGLTFIFSAAQAEEISPRQWLEKMSSAMQELNYEGVFVYRSEKDFSAMKVTHVVDDSGSHEMLETLTGDARKEVRQTPHNHLAKGQEVDSSGRLERIGNYYVLKLLGRDRTAGRMTRLLQVTPKDEYRYGYRLWLDEKTGLMLKSDLLDQNGEILEQVMFTSLDLLKPEQVAGLLPPHAATDNSGIIEPADNLEWKIEKLPSGFELLGVQPKVKGKDIDHMVYSDGLASVSVFVEHAKPESDALVGLSNMGAVNAFGGIRDKHQVTVVGEVPAITVKTICQSLKHRDAAQ
jgi:sigma-E factor negative regulatory protein RseB